MAASMEEQVYIDDFNKEKAVKRFLNNTSYGRSEGKDSIIGRAVFYLYGFFKREFCRRILRKIVLNLECGELYSINIRKIFKKYYYRDIGLYSGGGAFAIEAYSNKPPELSIGRFCSISHSVAIFNANHPLHTKSSHAFFYNPDLGYVDNDLLVRSKLTIGHDVWIGHNAVILPAVKEIGTGAVVAAGAIVYQDVSPYAIVAGNPARVIKYRFPKEQIKELIESKWWEMSMREIIDQFSSFLKSMVDYAD